MMRPFARHAVRGALSIAAAIVVAASDAHAQAFLRASDVAAKVDKKQVAFFLPLPYEGLKTPDSPSAGYFVWRINVETLQPFSLVVTSDTALRVAKASEVLKAVSVRLCADPVVESARACVSPIAATIEVESDHFRVILRDAELVARVRRERPDTYRRYVVAPGGRFLQTQHPFEHQVLERP